METNIQEQLRTIYADCHYRFETGMNNPFNLALREFIHTNGKAGILAIQAYLRTVEKLYLDPWLETFVWLGAMHDPETLEARLAVLHEHIQHPHPNVRDYIYTALDDIVDSEEGESKIALNWLQEALKTEKDDFLLRYLRDLLKTSQDSPAGG